MASLPIRWIALRTLCQATEDEDRVRRALDTACPLGEVSRTALEGHYGNPMILLTRRVDEPKAIASLWKMWSGAGLLEGLRERLEDRVDEEGILHFRIDKQKAFLGVLALAQDADTVDVQVKLKAYPAKAETYRNAARELILGGV